MALCVLVWSFVCCFFPRRLGSPVMHHEIVDLEIPE